jgi:integrase
MKCDLLYVNSFRDRHGRWRYYFRRKGAKAVALPGHPGSVEFIAEYSRCLEQKPSVAVALRSKPGTLDALREMYFASAEFANLGPTTQREIRYVIDALCATPTKDGGKRGDKRVVTLERKHILAWRDKMKDRPGAANKLMRTLKGLLSFAVDRGMRSDNPAFKIKMNKSTPFRDWTDEELIAFEERWPLGTLQRTGYALALYTAQRRADLASMKWSAISGNSIQVRQSKTGTVMKLSIHPELARALQSVHPRSAETILTGHNGKSLNVVWFGHLMAEAIENAGLPDACVLHGLRKTAARIVAEVGGNVASVTGHVTSQMANYYARRADQTANAEASVNLWAEHDKNKKRKLQTGE